MSNPELQNRWGQATELALAIGREAAEVSHASHAIAKGLGILDRGDMMFAESWPLAYGPGLSLIYKDKVARALHSSDSTEVLAEDVRGTDPFFLGETVFRYSDLQGVYGSHYHQKIGRDILRWNRHMHASNWQMLATIDYGYGRVSLRLYEDGTDMRAQFDTKVTESQADKRITKRYAWCGDLAIVRAHPRTVLALQAAEARRQQSSDIIQSSLV